MGLFSLPFTSNNSYSHTGEEFCKFTSIRSFFLVFPLAPEARSPASAWYCAEHYRAPARRYSPARRCFMAAGRAAARGRAGSRQPQGANADVRIAPRGAAKAESQRAGLLDALPRVTLAVKKSPLAKTGPRVTVRTRFTAAAARGSLVTAGSETCPTARDRPRGQAQGAAPPGEASRWARGPRGLCSCDSPRGSGAGPGGGRQHPGRAGSTPAAPRDPPARAPTCQP